MRDISVTLKEGYIGDAEGFFYRKCTRRDKIG